MKSSRLSNVVWALALFLAATTSLAATRLGFVTDVNGTWLGSFIGTFNGEVFEAEIEADDTVGGSDYIGGEFTHVRLLVLNGGNLFWTDIHFDANNIFKYTPSTVAFNSMVGTGGAFGVSGPVLAITPCK